MKITPLAIPDVIAIEPQIFEDNRGYFFESFNMEKLSQAIARDITFVQDNESYSKQDVLRGLHYQINHPQGKLVRVTAGAVFDVAVDLRRGSANFGRWVGEHLSAENKRQLWIPEGFAHGFFVLSKAARCHYKVTDYQYPQYERCLRYDDADVAIEWPFLKTGGVRKFLPQLSARDRLGVSLCQTEIFKNL